MATNICRRFSNCSSSFPPGVSVSEPSVASSLGSFDTFVSPSTSARTSGPKRRSTSSNRRNVSSTVSCSSPATTVSRSIDRSASRIDTATGWLTKGSPLRRFWPACAPWATISASRTTARSSFGRYAMAFSRRFQSRSTARMSARATASWSRSLHVAFAPRSSFLMRDVRRGACISLQSSSSCSRLYSVRIGCQSRPVHDRSGRASAARRTWRRTPRGYGRRGA